MEILVIEQMFQSEDTLGQVLEKCQPDFNIIDEIANNRLISNICNNPEEAKSTLLQVTGAYSNLTTVLSIAMTEKKNREIRAYERLRIETENADKKFVSTVADKTASAEIASYRRVRNIVQGYVSAAEKQISSLQSVLKYESTKYTAEPK